MSELVHGKVTSKTIHSTKVDTYEDAIAFAQEYVKELERPELHITSDFSASKGYYFSVEVSGVSARQGATPPSCENHKEEQHRDGRRPWCNACGWAHARPGMLSEKVSYSLSERPPAPADDTIKPARRDGRSRKAPVE